MFGSGRPTVDQRALESSGDDIRVRRSPGRRDITDAFGVEIEAERPVDRIEYRSLCRSVVDQHATGDDDGVGADTLGDAGHLSAADRANRAAAGAEGIGGLAGLDIGPQSREGLHERPNRLIVPTPDAGASVPTGRPGVNERERPAGVRDDTAADRALDCGVAPIPGEIAGVFVTGRPRVPPTERDLSVWRPDSDERIARPGRAGNGGAGRVEIGGGRPRPTANEPNRHGRYRAGRTLSAPPESVLTAETQPSNMPAYECDCGARLAAREELERVPERTGRSWRCRYCGAGVPGRMAERIQHESDGSPTDRC